MILGQSLVLVLAMSLAVQALAAITAWREMGNSGRYRFAWLCLSLALLLMVERRAVTLREALSGDRADEAQAALGLATSLLMSAGVWGLRRLFATMRKQEVALASLACTDALTGLPNRREILRRLETELERCRRSQRPMSLLMFDVDHFKLVNDRHGHAAGDLVLQVVAEVGTCALRRIDSLGRIGGDEFLVLLPEAGAAEARSAAERLRAAIAARRVDFGEESLAITASIGVMTCLPERAEQRSERLVAAADKALYRAKEGGRDRVALADAG